MSDTTQSIQRRYDEMIMAKSPAERVHMAGRMFSAARRLAIAGILHEQPHIDEVELQRQVFLRFYGSDFTTEELERIFASIPQLRRSA